MRVCLFGTYIPGLMISVLKKRLELQNIQVLECREDIRKNFFSIASAYVKLALKHKNLDYSVKRVRHTDFTGTEFAGIVAWCRRSRAGGSFGRRAHGAKLASIFGRVGAAQAMTAR